MSQLPLEAAKVRFPDILKATDSAESIVRALDNALFKVLRGSAIEASVAAAEVLLEFVMFGVREVSPQLVLCLR